MKVKSKVSLIFGIIFLVVAIVWIGSSISNLNQKQQAVTQSDQQVKEACQGVKDALLNPNLPQSDYQNGLVKYNNDCGSISGRLP